MVAVAIPDAVGCGGAVVVWDVDEGDVAAVADPASNSCIFILTMLKQAAQCL